MGEPSEEKELLTDEEYTMVFSRLVLLAGLLRDMKLKQFMNNIEHCETVAPLLDPSLYQRGGAKLSLMKQTTAAFLSAQKNLPKMEEWIDAQAQQNAWEALRGMTGG